MFSHTAQMILSGKNKLRSCTRRRRGEKCSGERGWISLFMSVCQWMMSWRLGKGEDRGWIVCQWMMRCRLGKGEDDGVSKLSRMSYIDVVSGMYSGMQMWGACGEGEKWVVGGACRKGEKWARVEVEVEVECKGESRKIENKSGTGAGERGREVDRVKK